MTTLKTAFGSAMKKLATALGSDAAKQIYLDLIGLLGLGLLCFGTFQVYEPAAPIVGGLSIMAFAFKASK